MLIRFNYLNAETLDAGTKAVKKLSKGFILEVKIIDHAMALIKANASCNSLITIREQYPSGEVSQYS